MISSNLQVERDMPELAAPRGNPPGVGCRCSGLCSTAAALLNSACRELNKQVAVLDVQTRPRDEFMSNVGILAPLAK